MRVGFIGLGRMGLPMSLHLIRAGHEVVVHNRTREKEDPAVQAGGLAAASPYEAARGADMVLACLPSLQATRDVFLGDLGVIAAAAPETVLVDHSTISPELAQEVGRAADAQGCAFLDAPISGGPAGAEAGTLTIMAGGPQQAFDRVEPVFQAMGDNVRRVGELGAGTVAKLVNQLLTFVHATAAAEAMILAASAGARPMDLLPILRTAWGQSTMLERGIEKVHARDFQAGAPLRLFRKDMGLVREMARASGISLPLVEAAGERLEEALAMESGEADLVAVLRPYERDSAVTVGGS